MNGGVAVFGEHEEKTLGQIRDVASVCRSAALMADGHLGYWMPIGGVASFHGQVSVVGVGFDIACGNCAIKTDLRITDLVSGRHDLRGTVADMIASQISFGMGRNNKADDAPTDHPLFDSPAWDALRDRAGHGNARQLKDKARNQLGTVGSGNHYVDVFDDETGALWVGVHFGSRGLGHGIASGYLAVAQGKQWGDRAPEEASILDLRSSAGQEYWSLMELAGQYAYAGREWVARKVVGILGGREVDMVHNHHNFAWRETHGGEDVVVVRKGATPAFPGQRGFVGGSMGDDAVILEGVDSPESESAMRSTVHGAGRVMSRTAAAGKVRRFSVWGCGNHRQCDGWLPISTPQEKGGANPRCPKCGAKTHRVRREERVSEGLVRQEDVDRWLAERGVVLRGAGLDEAPQAYRRLPDVLAAQGGTVRVLHTLRPLIVVMAGPDVQDPYKD